MTSRQRREEEEEVPHPEGPPSPMDDSLRSLQEASHRSSLPPEKRRIIFLKFTLMAFLFISAVMGLIALYLYLPGLSGEGRTKLEAILPSSLSDLQRLRDLDTLRNLCAIVGGYKQQHPIALALLLSYLYLLYQAFPLFMFPFSGLAMAVTLVLGALYSSVVAFCLASLLSAIGPSLAFFLFMVAGKPVVVRFFPKQLQRMKRLLHPEKAASSHQDSTISTISSSSSSSSETNTIAQGSRRRSACLRGKQQTLLHAEAIQKQQQEQQHEQEPERRRRHPRLWDIDIDLTLTLLFLRISPFPNLVINAASPVLDVPFGSFLIATWLGLMPNAALFVSMGSALGSLDSLSSGWRPVAVFVVGAIAVALLKAALRKARPSRFAEAEADAADVSS